jgi:hypothetical protein
MARQFIAPYMTGKELVGVVCMHCQNEWIGAMPRGFIYSDEAAGWTPQVAQGYLSGYCPPCADEIANGDHGEYVNGNWERRNLEDERYVWPS